MLENTFYVPGTCGRKEFYQQHGCQKLADIMDLTDETCLLYLQRVTKDHALRETWQTNYLTTVIIINSFFVIMMATERPCGAGLWAAGWQGCFNKGQGDLNRGGRGENFLCPNSGLFLTCNTGLSWFRLAAETSATRAWQAHLGPRLLCFVDLGKGCAERNLPHEVLSHHEQMFMDGFFGISSGK